jgi:hypothetical protein
MRLTSDFSQLSGSRRASDHPTGKYQQFLDDVRVEAQESHRRLRLRQTNNRKAEVSPDELGDLATVGAYLFAHQGLEDGNWDKEMLRRFPQLDQSDLEKILKYARKL